MTVERVSNEDEDRPGLQLSGGAISALSGGGLLLLFMIQNTDDVSVTFLFWDFTMPVWLLTLGAAILGAFVWLGLGILRRHRRRRERREDRRN